MLYILRESLLMKILRTWSPIRTLSANHSCTVYFENVFVSKTTRKQAASIRRGKAESNDEEKIVEEK